MNEIQRILLSRGREFLSMKHNSVEVSGRSPLWSRPDAELAIDLLLKIEQRWLVSRNADGVCQRVYRGGCVHKQN